MQFQFGEVDSLTASETDEKFFNAKFMEIIVYQLVEKGEIFDEGTETEFGVVSDDELSVTVGGGAYGVHYRMEWVDDKQAEIIGFTSESIHIIFSCKSKSHVIQVSF